MPGPGPITRVIIQTLWKRLFDASADNPIFLPRVIKNGYPSWDLPSYDPATPEGTSDPIPIGGVPADVADSACLNPDMPIVPIATTVPKLQLQNVMFTNLSVMSPRSLTFSDSEPLFTAVVGVGAADQPFTLKTNKEGTPNFLFQIGCCEPESATSRKCGDRYSPWTADASGGFVAKAHDGEVSVTIRLNTAGGGPLTVKIEGVGVSVPDPKNVTVDFEISSAEKWVQQMAEIAVNQGVGMGAIVQGLQSFLNSPDVIANIETLVNNALKNILQEVPVA